MPLSSEVVAARIAVHIATMKVAAAETFLRLSRRHSSHVIPIRRRGEWARRYDAASICGARRSTSPTRQAWMSKR
jgi:hypothetical protein